MTPGAEEDLSVLVRRAQGGEEAAFGALYRQRVSLVYRYAKSIVRNPTVAEDVTAQAFLQAWGKISSLRKAERFDAWLLRITHNLALNEVRRPPPAPIEDVPEPADHSRHNDPLVALSGKWEAEVVRSALQDLPDLLREVLVLRYFAGLSHATVASQLGKSEGNVRVLQHRALRRMRDALAGSGLDPSEIGATINGA